jgi:hypothetical protein
MSEWIFRAFDALPTENAFWTILSIILGTLISIYTTLIFARSTRFSETIRDLEMNRQHFDGYPITPDDFDRSLPRATGFYRLIEKIEWRLNVDRHYKAASEVSRLRQFIYWATAKTESMKAKGNELSSPEFSHFQLTYQKVYNREGFRQLGHTLRPSLWALLRPFPHSALPIRSITKTIEID